MIFIKRITKIVIALLVFSLIVYILQKHTISGFILNVYTGPVIFSYWYLYAYLGLLICLPWLRKMISLFRTEDYLIFTFVFLLFTGIFPVLSAEKVLPQFAKDFSIPLVAAPIGYVVCGKFISNENKQRDVSNKLVFGSIMGLILALIIPALITSREYSNFGKFSLALDSYSSIFAIISSFCIFYLVDYLVPKIGINGMAKKIIISFSTATFGIYLIHIIIILKCGFVFQFLCSRMNSLIAVVIYELFIFLTGYIITKLLQKIPFINKII